MFSKGENVPFDILCHILEKYLSLILGINYFEIKKWSFVAPLRIKQVNLLGVLLFGESFFANFDSTLQVVLFGLEVHFQQRQCFAVFYLHLIGFSFTK